ncbi:MAG: BACON domain-containing protein, partial [Prevotellaceae bacterium]|nr:BACON domain-containing protein [Prevotellaceae bacterium]
MILIPTINPIRLSLSGLNEPKVEYAFYRDYYQKFQRTDVTKIQILIPADEPSKNWTLSAVNVDDEAISYTIPKVPFDDKVDNHLVIEYNIDFSRFQEGKYRFFLQSGNGLKYNSDIVCVKNTHEYTRLLSYCNTYNEHGVVFSTGVVFHLRVESQLYKAVIPKSEDSIYNNNLGGYRILNSSPYDNYRLNIGGTAGIPDWLMRIINQAFSCDTLFLNNVEITKADGATFEPIEQDNYNLRSWNIEIGHIENSLFYEEHLLTVNGENQLALNISRNPQAIPIIIFATTAWEVVGNYPNWITVTPLQGGTNGNTVKLTFKGNTKTIVRSGTVFFRLKDMHALTVEISVAQEGTAISSVIWTSFVLT